MRHEGPISEHILSITTKIKIYDASFLGAFIKCIIQLIIGYAMALIRNIIIQCNFFNSMTLTRSVIVRCGLCSYSRVYNNAFSKGHSFNTQPWSFFKRYCNNLKTLALLISVVFYSTLYAFVFQLKNILKPHLHIPPRNSKNPRHLQTIHILRTSKGKTIDEL